MKTGISNRIILFCLLAAPASAFSLQSMAQEPSIQLSLECSTNPTEDISHDVLVFKSDKSGGPWSLGECAGDDLATSCRDAGLLPAEGMNNSADGSTQIKVNCDDCDAAFDSAIISLPTADLQKGQPFIQGQLQKLSNGASMGDAQMLTCRTSNAVLTAVKEAQAAKVSQQSKKIASPIFQDASQATIVDPKEVKPVDGTKQETATQAEVAPVQVEQNVACSTTGKSAVLGDTQKSIFSAKNGEVIHLLGQSKQIKIAGKVTPIVSIQIASSGLKGWIDQNSVRTMVQCSLINGIAFHEVTNARRQVKKPAAKPVAKPARNAKPAATPKLAKIVADVGPQSCAQKVILAAAKKYERAKYGDRPESGGTCAFGVNRELVASHVGGIQYGFGYGAVDFTKGLPAHGYVDTGLRDPKTAPPGAVIVFAGPQSALYLRTGEQEGASAGTWAGHVTIKGDDGFYYTDARTKAPAVGWNTESVNISHVRNVIGIYLPGPALIAQYANKCDN